MTSIEEILDDEENGPPEEEVTLCLQGKLVAQYERLKAQLEEVSETAPESLADVSPRAAIIEQMAALYAKMKLTKFKLRAMLPLVWSDFYAGLPDISEAIVDGEVDDELAKPFRVKSHAWACQLVASSCYDPAMTPAQAEKLAEKLSKSQWTELTDAAWRVNMGRQQIPFFDVASELPQVTGPK